MRAKKPKMAVLKEETKMNDQIRRSIRQRASMAHSNDDLVNAVFDSFRGAQIVLEEVSLDDMKNAVVEAARSARSRNLKPEACKPTAV